MKDLRYEQFGYLFILMILVGLILGFFPVIGPIHEFGHQVACKGEGVIDGWTHHTYYGKIHPEYFLFGYFMELMFLTLCTLFFCWFRRWWVQGLIIGHAFVSVFYAIVGSDTNKHGPKAGYSHEMLIEKWWELATPILIFICVVITIDIIARVHCVKKEKIAQSKHR